MLQDASGHRVPATKRVGSAIGGNHIIATVIGAGFFAISIGAIGADLGSGYSTAYAVPSHVASARQRPPPARSIDPPEVRPDRSMHHTRVVDSCMAS
jgi:hypothetical protein